MAADKNVAIRKRQQIENAGKVMFLWVAIAAAVVGMAAVVSVSLFQRMTFNQRVIGEKNHTIDTLKKNNALVDDLKKNIRVLNTNQALVDTPRLEGTEPLSVVLDAMPSQANSSALGASLQQKLLDVPGVSIEALTVDPISGVEDSGDTSTTDSGSNEITFEFIVSANADRVNALKQVLLNLQRSIRVIDVQTLNIEQQNNKITLSVDGRAFYQPETTVELKEKAVKP